MAGKRVQPMLYSQLIEMYMSGSRVVDSNRVCEALSCRLDHMAFEEEYSEACKADGIIRSHEHYQRALLARAKKHASKYMRDNY